MNQSGRGHARSKMLVHAQLSILILQKPSFIFYQCSALERLTTWRCFQRLCILYLHHCISSFGDRGPCKAHCQKLASYPGTKVRLSTTARCALQTNRMILSVFEGRILSIIAYIARPYACI